ncbi:MAG TPA: EVE domain-containing protein [Limnochordia bacterium]
MAYWLLKTEPDEYSYDDLVQEETDVWDGVRNPTALRHLRQMRPGDEVFVYHSGKERAIVGIGRVVSEPYPDPAQGDPKLTVVDVRAVRRLPQPVTLAMIKGRPEFADWELVRLPRLSVMPVKPAYWHSVLAIAGEGSGQV